MSLQIQFANGESVEAEVGARPSDLFEQAGIRAKKVIAAKLDDEIIELDRPMEQGGLLTYLPKCDGKKPCNTDSLHVLRHTAAHVMAQAVMRLFDNVEFAIGPTIEDGFYYDFDLEHRLSDEDFEAIEAEMRKIIAADYPVLRREVDDEEAEAILGAQKAQFKRELVKGLEGQQLSFYSQDDFTDLCRGPHLGSTGQIGAFKLLSVAGAYWRGRETNPMLQRIYGTAFFTEKDLKKYLNKLEEAKKRDHKKLGARLNLFMFDPSGPGFPFWQPRGVRLYRQVENLMYEKMDEYEYDMIRTPMILNEQLWRESGHWDHYRENMYFTEIDEKAFAVKPMNCPGGTRVFNSGYYSYRDLPVRQGEFGLVHRHEKSGVLSGLFRVRNFTQDDAHIYCTPDQVVEEVVGCLKMVKDIYSQFGFEDYRFELSTRPDKSIGSDEMWQMGESALEKALAEAGIDYQLNPGDGAFYGPKIDVHIRDAIKRTWQCGTIQVDFSMPERFDLNYINEEGEKVRPVMIHRAIYGSFERFIGILIEHYAGKFPTWLAPTQAVILPISNDRFGEYADKVYAELKKAGVRVEVDGRNESLNKRIREQQKLYVPYMLVVGEREMEDGTVAVRRRDGVQLPEAITASDFAQMVLAEQKSRTVEMTIGAEAAQSA
jgi:threonyl-tRNA synthetase